ncbi:MarR family winged helix-turn-helix transcriptional regulator [Sutcliffiella rhizosphaerae]|uniref:HTH-type transcriptional regulator SarZ n=1 Tax=Sutcliffiella rhizosphaerae TaxID=2880967 RepID=A0ABM8YKT0_9BACI|nr:MarR family winged helix-turn-helix transcriptional regulator [Sutcliffiella rhizosphaerae]CAG9620403.1 hypothetical protein BACCIP111883_01171 [Sutcliffiella rhizosphaerae]
MFFNTTINSLNENWTNIYYLLHHVYEEISHQAIRLLQHIEKNRETTIGDLAKYLGVTHNTASEHIKRLITKGFVSKKRSVVDERKVCVILTERGSEILYRNTRLDDEKLNKVLEGLTKKDIELIEKAFSLLSREAKKCF